MHSVRREYYSVQVYSLQAVDQEEDTESSRDDAPSFPE